MKFSKAIVRIPCPEMTEGITTANLGPPDYKKALAQHHKYIEALENLDVAVKILKPDSRFPDSTFVEDVALCTPKMAVVTAPGAASRQGEEVEMTKVLSSFYKDIERIEFPGTLEAGDVMMCGSHFFIGISDRTNHAGADQLISLLEKYNMTGEKVVFADILHLKTGVSYFENNTMLMVKALESHPAFKDYKKILVPDQEAYAANSLWINGTILVPAGFPETKSNLESAGFPVLELEMTEFRKIDGGLSCLSLRF